MKKILIIRSANMTVINKLIDYIVKKYNNQTSELYALIQKGSVIEFNKRYPSIACIEKEDGFFSYKDFKKNVKLKNKLKEIKFDEVYIPSSYPYFNEFYDTFLIANSINTNKYILFNSLEEIQFVKFYKFVILTDKYFGEFIYTIKVSIALIIVAMCYIFYFPYFKIKNAMSGDK